MYITPTQGMSDEQQQELSQNQHITHPVSKHDTLEGLSVQYGINVEAIRKYNNLTTNQIYHLKQVCIPNQDYQQQFKPIQNIEDPKLRIRESFFKILNQNDKSQKIVDYYLNLCDWDLEAAIVEYQQDISQDR